MGAHLGHSFLDSPERGLRSGSHLLLHLPLCCVLFSFPSMPVESKPKWWGNLLLSISSRP